MTRLINNALGRIGLGINRIKKLEDDKPLYERYYPRESLDRRAFYNISFGGHFGFGCDFTHPLWTNIDVDRPYPLGWPQFNPSRDIPYDPFHDVSIPLDTGSAELFHSRFSFEHIFDDHARLVLKEIHRCLKPGGIIHLVIPNLEFDYHAYRTGDRAYFNWVDNFSKPEMMELMRYAIPMREMSMHQVFLTHFAANASPHHLDGSGNPIPDDEFAAIMGENPFEKAMDLCTLRCSPEKQRAYRQNHVNWWSPVKMEKFLREAGFKYIIPLSAGQSVSPVLRGNPRFDWLWKDIAFVIEAKK